MRHLFYILLALTVSMTAGAQKADKLYEEGKALYDSKKYDKAFPKLKAAAEQGHKKAQYRLGRCYDKGHGVEEDNSTAAQWYQKAALQGSAKAQYQLGKAYLKGKGVPSDQQKAREWLLKSVRNKKGGDKVLDKMRGEAKQGDATAKKMLGLIGK